jgi:predicted dehydrogenase
MMRWALAGYGDLSERRLVEALGDPPGRLACVWGRHGDRARDFATRHQIPRFTESLTELCRDVDAVYVATPVSRHVEIATTALRAGCHVLIEKPLAAGVASSDELRTLAIGSGRSVGVAYYRRLAPALRRLHEIVRTGVCGRVRHLVSEFAVPFEPSPGEPMFWRTQREHAGAGVLADAGSHRLDLACWLLGVPLHVTARLDRVFAGGCERRAELRVEWPDAISGAFRFEWGASRVDRLRVTLEDGEIVVVPLDSGRVRMAGPGGARVEERPPALNPHRELVRDFEAAVQSGCSPVCSLEEGILVDRIIEAALRSNGNGGEREPIDASRG